MISKLRSGFYYGGIGFGERFSKPVHISSGLLFDELNYDIKHIGRDSFADAVIFGHFACNCMLHEVV